MTYRDLIQETFAKGPLHADIMTPEGDEVTVEIVKSDLRRQLRHRAKRAGGLDAEAELEVIDTNIGRVVTGKEA